MPLPSTPQPSIEPLRRATLRTAVAPVISLASLFLALDAAAHPGQSFDLDWNSPPRCPKQVDVEEQIHEILGNTSGATLPGGLGAKGVIEPIKGRYRLTLTVRIGETERSRVITSDDCASLGKAAAVVLGLLIRRASTPGRELSDLDLGSGFQPATAPAPAPSQPTDPKTPPELPPKPTKPKAERVEPAQSQSHAPAKPRPHHFLVEAPVATLDYLTLPKVGYGIGIAAGVIYKPWRWFVEGTLWPAQRVTQGGLEPYEATFTRKSVESWICRGWRSGAFELSPCLLAAIDIITASASAKRLTTVPQSIILASAGVGMMGHWHWTETVGLFLSVAGRVAIHRSEFVVSGMLSNYQAHIVPRETVVTSVGVEWNF